MTIQPDASPVGLSGGKERRKGQKVNEVGLASRNLELPGEEEQERNLA